MADTVETTGRTVGHVRAGRAESGERGERHGWLRPLIPAEAETEETEEKAGEKAGGKTGRTGRAASAHVPPDVAELVIGEATIAMSGRVLHLVLWLARHQERINALAPEAGQVWMTWKGHGARSISGDLKTPL